MTTCLYNFLTAGADGVAATVPGGWVLTVISVSVVFAALIILYGIYSLSGKFFSRGTGLKVGKTGKSAEETAAALAVAMYLSEDNDEGAQAAIALALHLHSGENAHDIEPGTITILKKESPWADKSRMMRRMPSR